MKIKIIEMPPADLKASEQLRLQIESLTEQLKLIESWRGKYAQFFSLLCLQSIADGENPSITVYDQQAAGLLFGVDGWDVVNDVPAKMVDGVMVRIFNGTFEQGQ